MREGGGTAIHERKNFWSILIASFPSRPATSGPRLLLPGPRFSPEAIHRRPRQLFDVSLAIQLIRNLVQGLPRVLSNAVRGQVPAVGRDLSQFVRSADHWGRTRTYISSGSRFAADAANGCGIKSVARQVRYLSAI
jgi:hypothetical protein